MRGGSQPSCLESNRESQDPFRDASDCNDLVTAVVLELSAKRTIELREFQSGNDGNLLAVSGSSRIGL